MRISLLVAFAGIAGLYIARSKPGPASPEPPALAATTSAPALAVAATAPVRVATPPRLPALPVAPAVDDRAVEDHAVEQAPRTGGVVTGTIRARHTHEPLAGATVVVTVSEGRIESAITDEDGFYEISGLPAGEYLLTVYYLETTIEQLVTIEASAPTVVPDLEVTEEPVHNIPVPGRTFEAVLGSVSGSQDGDNIGVSISSDCGVENTYIVEDPHGGVTFENLPGVALEPQHDATGM